MRKSMHRNRTSFLRDDEYAALSLTTLRHATAFLKRDAHYSPRRW